MRINNPNFYSIFSNTNMRYLAIIFTLCFLLSAFVQFNDPDPVIWITLYLVPALVSILFLKTRLNSYIYLSLAVLYFAIAIYQWPPEFEGFLFGEVQTMRNMNIELARESFGMGIVAVAMLILGIHVRRTESKS